jgi:hypothetical protein
MLTPLRAGNSRLLAKTPVSEQPEGWTVERYFVKTYRRP